MSSPAAVTYSPNEIVVCAYLWHAKHRSLKAVQHIGTACVHRQSRDKGWIPGSELLVSHQVSGNLMVVFIIFIGANAAVACEE